MELSGGGTYRHIISLENLLAAWREFKRGKRKRQEVQKFEFNLEENLFELHELLKTKTYKHLPYTPFYIQDPKLRHIHKANIRDRVLHQAVFRVLYFIFDKNFIYDSYSCRLNKGTHRAVSRLEEFAKKVSYNNHRNFFALKCDIKRFFDSVDQSVLIDLIKKKVKDGDALWLIDIILKSFQKENGKGLPLGNVTSQLFANIYLNELDQFIKNDLKIRYYLRYCDDFVILSSDKKFLDGTITEIRGFLLNHLKLDLHERKVIFRRYTQGIDYVGYIALPHHKLLRIKTKRRILRRLISRTITQKSLPSYLGMLKHCRGYKIKKQVLSLIK